MKRLLFGLLLAIGVTAAIMSSQRPQHRVYTVMEVQTDLERHPEVWLGRTVLVRGAVQLWVCLSSYAVSGAPCRDRSVYLLDRDGASLLPLAGWQPDPLLAVLRRLPLAGRLVPAPQVVHWGTLATYRARLLAASSTACSAAPCYEALLLDAAP